MARNTLILLKHAIERVGLPLTANGNLSRATVADMCKLIRSEKLPSSRFGEHDFYRKMELFDRLLAFDVQVDLSEGIRH